MEPADDLGLGVQLRGAIARRVARTAANARLLAEYPAPTDPELVPLAEGEALSDAKLATLASHVDMIAIDPAPASEAHLHALLDVGFTIPQVIALSELLGFVCFQIRIAHGLSLLDGAS